MQPFETRPLSALFTRRVPTGPELDYSCRPVIGSERCNSVYALYTGGRFTRANFTDCLQKNSLEICKVVLTIVS